MPVAPAATVRRKQGRGIAIRFTGPRMKAAQPRGCCDGSRQNRQGNACAARVDGAALSGCAVYAPPYGAYAPVPAVVPLSSPSLSAPYYAYPYDYGYGYGRPAYVGPPISLNFGYYEHRYRGGHGWHGGHDGPGYRRGPGFHGPWYRGGPGGPAGPGGERAGLDGQPWRARTGVEWRARRLRRFPRRWGRPSLSAVAATFRGDPHPCVRVESSHDIASRAVSIRHTNSARPARAQRPRAVPNPKVA
jgi:hypothetical protein